MIAIIAVLLIISTFVVAFVLYRVMSKREAEAEKRADEDQADVTRLQAIRDGLRLLIGPFPLSVALHVLALLFLIITVHEQRGRELIMVNLEAGGGGGGGSEMQDLDMPEVPMPDTAPQQMDSPTAVDTSQAVGLANDYVRAAGGGGIGIGRGGGMGSGYGHGIGSGFGGFIGELRRKGLDVVLVIDGTGSMNLIIDLVERLDVGIGPLQNLFQAEFVERAEPHALGALAHGLHHAALHLSRGLIRERQPENVFAGEFGIGFEQAADALGDHARLPRPRARNHQQRPFAVLHRRPLLRVQGKAQSSGFVRLGFRTHEEGFRPPILADFPWAKVRRRALLAERRRRFRRGAVRCGGLPALALSDVAGWKGGDSSPQQTTARSA